MRKIVATLVLLVMFVGMIPATSFAADALLPAQSDSNMKFNAENTYIVITPEMFKNESIGGWFLQNGVAYQSHRAKSMQDSDADKVLKDASLNIAIPKDGEYTVFVHSRDFAENNPGSRNFDVLLDGEKIGTAGQHKLEGWAWEKMDSKSLDKGGHVISFADKQKSGRFDLVVITDDKNFFPSNIQNEMIEMELKYAYDINSTVYISDKPPVEGALPNALLPKSATANMNFKDDCDYFVVTPEMFADKGGWMFQQGESFNSYRKQVMVDSGDGTDSANFDFKVPKDGTYKVLVHSRDFATSSPGERVFGVTLDGQNIGSGGMHCEEGWAWEQMLPKYLTSGETVLSIIDNGKFGRFDLIVITNDLDFFPGNTAEELVKLETEYAYDASKITIEETDRLAGRPDTEIAVKFNGEWMTFDVPPMLINDRTMVPMRAIFEALGCDVSWNNDSETATGDRNGKKVSVTIGSDIAVVDGKPTKIDQSAVLINDRTLVPLRFISEAYGADVEWDNDNQVVTIKAVIPATAYYIMDNSYNTYGTWKPETKLSDGSGTLIGTQPEYTGGAEVTIEDADARNTKPAVCKFQVAKEGDYKIWVRARDFETNQQGTRSFDVHVNGKETARRYGQHGKTGYRWEDGGIVHLNKGENVVEVLDTSGFFARLAGIYITSDLVNVPSNSHETLLGLATKVDPSATAEVVTFPRWATEELAATETVSISSDKVKVNFYTVNDGNGKQFIQNEILLNDNGNWLVAKAKTEQFGLLQLKSDEASTPGSLTGHYMAQVKFNNNDKEFEFQTNQLYKMGENTWLIPSKAEKVGDSVKVYYDDVNGASVVETWEFDSLADAPKVTLNATFSQKGNYSFVMSNGGEVIDSDMDAVTMPFISIERRAPDSAKMVIAKYMFTPISTVTIASDKTGFNKPLTRGVAVEGSLIPDWTYDSNSTFMGGLRGASQGLLGVIAAPIMGYENAKFNPGDTYSFTYRPVNELKDWFESYKSIVTNYYNYHDGRNNYYASLNDAIYNATDLMMDDWYGGWDDIHKAHWNEEAKGVSTLSTPLAATQRFLLTGNEDILEKRAIPTLANLIGRNYYHFKRSMDMNTMYTPNLPIATGGYNRSFPSSTYVGAYNLTQGQSPFMLGLAEEMGVAGGASIGPFHTTLNAITLYQVTGEQKYLAEAKKYGDAYIEATLGNEEYMTSERDWVKFTNIDFYPNLSTLLGLYEITGEQKYLDAAEKTGRMLAATTFTMGFQDGKSDKDIVIKREEVLEHSGAVATAASHYWHGEEQWTLRGKETELLPEEETVPGWLPTRVGIGIESGTGHEIADSGCQVMSAWAADMVRLSEYTGEEYFYDLAKNAIIGRYANYPGYYVWTYSVHQMKPDYPYVGPDTTQLYYHHIPTFLGFVEDFLITDAWARSDQAINFPSVRHESYAYFGQNAYGYEPGKVYDLEDMWIWNDRGIVEADTVLLNYLPARKEGKLAVAFMNTDKGDVTSTITLGEKVEGGASYSGAATVYDAKGNKSTTEVVNGKFTITIPAKGITTVALDIPTIKVPNYAEKGNFVNGSDLGGTVSEHNRGRGYVLQLTPDKYYAFIYVTDADGKEPGTAKSEYRANSATLKYTVNGKAETIVNKEYPYEFIIPVNDVDAKFEYTISVEKTDGIKEELGGGTLMSAQKSKADGFESKLKPIYDPNKANLPSVSSALPEFEPFEIKYVGAGSGNNKLRFAVPLEQFKGKFQITDNILQHVKAIVEFTNIETNETIIVETTVFGNESRPNDPTNFTLYIEPTEKMPASSYRTSDDKRNKFKITLVYPD